MVVGAPVPRDYCGGPRSAPGRPPLHAHTDDDDDEGDDDDDAGPTQKREGRGNVGGPRAANAARARVGSPGPPRRRNGESAGSRGAIQILDGYIRHLTLHYEDLVSDFHLAWHLDHSKETQVLETKHTNKSKMNKTRGHETH